MLDKAQGRQALVTDTTGTTQGRQELVKDATGKRRHVTGGIGQRRNRSHTPRFAFFGFFLVLPVGAGGGVAAPENGDAPAVCNMYGCCDFK